MKEKGKIRWAAAWSIRSFRRKLVAALVLLALVLGWLPVFFNQIQNRKGRPLPDLLLDILPALDFSIGVFSLIWICAGLLLVRVAVRPLALLVAVCAYDLMTVLRMACIYVFSLEPPLRLIPLRDPMTNAFYGTRYITHDLFFSGHTATLFVIFFCLEKKADRLFAGLAAGLTGAMLLFQHVHYTIDVLAAPVVSWICYLAARRFTTSERGELTSG